MNIPRWTAAPKGTGEKRSWRTSRRRVAAAAAGVVAAGVAAGFTVAAGSGSGPAAAAAAAVSVPPPAVSVSGFPRGQGGGGIFTDRCRFSHQAADDPILMPSMAGQSMQHDFFGNTTTSASSTASALLGKPTTCSTPADASAYWTPVLYQNGRPLQPVSALIYWRQARTLASMVKPMPAGISLIAGDEKAAQPQSPKVIRWTCSGDQNTRDVTSTPHDCRGDQMLRLVVTFPSCWDGHTLGGAAQANAVYPAAGRCPASHPVVIPQIVFHVSYPTSSAADLTLSMSPTMHGSTDTAHADFINGWDQALLARNTSACIAAHLRCGPVTGTGAVPQGPKTAGNRPGTQHQRKHNRQVNVPMKD
jgi:hypothetical protein